MVLPPLSSPLRRSTVAAWIVLAALPVAYIAVQVAVYSRNIVFWDEFDTVLDLLLRLDAGASWTELGQRLFAVNNEHRMVTSRLLFAVGYWLTGTVNFHVIGAIGNLFLLGAGAVLVWAVDGTARRVRLAVVFALLVFHLEHYENLFWSGSSIDHFQVVLLAVGVFAALLRPGRVAFACAGGLGLLATFTLAHGLLVWPLGALLLLGRPDRRPLWVWLALAAAAAAAFLQGFAYNPGHRIPALTLETVLHVVRFWLALLGSPMTFGVAAHAPLPGLLLLAGLVVVVARGAWRQQPLAVATALFALGSLGLVALGRSELALPLVSSRYLVLGALAWAMLFFLLVEAATDPARPFRVLLWLTPAFVGFNLAANVQFAPRAEDFIEWRDRAGTMFKHYGEDGRDIVRRRLHPIPGHADSLLRRTAERGIYRLPEFSRPRAFSAPLASDRIVTHFDELLANDRAVTAGGWAMLPGRTSRRGQVYVVLRSEKSLLYFSTVTLPRDDVARAYKEPRWRLGGFRAVIDRDRLPAEDFDVGILVAGPRPEFRMTGNRLLLSSEKPVAVASAQ